jgi:hypothetical protein
VWYDAVGWGNTVGPVLGLGVLAVLVPWLVARGGLSQRRVMLGVGVATIVLWVVGAAIFALQYQWLGSDIWGDFATWPGRTAWVYLRRSGWFALFWGPILAFVWLVMAQGVERRRGLAMRDDLSER